MKCVNYKRSLGLFFVSISTLSLAKVDSEGNNGLMRAARQGDSKKVVGLLLGKYSGAMINDQNNNGNTALMLAVMSRNVPTVQKLLKYNIIDIDVQNKAGKTALDFAIELASGNKKDEIVRLLRGYKPSSLKVKNSMQRKPSSPKKSYGYTF